MPPEISEDDALTAVDAMSRLIGLPILPEHRAGVALNLARLMVQVELGLEGEAANTAMLGFTARKAELPELPPRGDYTVTVADVVAAEAPDAHTAAVRRWATAVWADWSDEHDFIRGWAQQG